LTKDYTRALTESEKTTVMSLMSIEQKQIFSEKHIANVIISWTASIPELFVAQPQVSL
jgi:hypothetical protein